MIPCSLIENGKAELLISELKDDVYLETDVRERVTEASFVPMYSSALFRDDKGANDSVYEIKAAVDDITGEALGYAREMIEKAGAADVYYTPVYMKKNRPGVLITCIAHEDKLESVIKAIMMHTSTRGVRYAKYSRRVREKPEYDDIAAAAKKYDVTIDEVIKSALKSKFK